MPNLEDKSARGRELNDFKFIYCYHCLGEQLHYAILLLFQAEGENQDIK